MKWVRRRRATRAPSLTIQRRISWPTRAVVLLGAMVLGALVALLWGHLIGVPANAKDDAQAVALAAANRDLVTERAERQRLEAIANAADSQIKVERAAAERLSRQVRELELDNARLKSDLSYLENLLPAGEGQSGLAIRGLRVEVDTSQPQLHFRALLTQGGRVDRDFIGTMQLTMQLVLQGRNQTLVVPEAGSPAPLRESMKLSFRRAHRVQAVVPLPAGATVRSVQLRIMEGGVARAQQTAMP